MDTVMHIFYKTIQLQDGSEWACNRNGEGIFLRRPWGTWVQQTGTGQTPRFKTAQALSRYVHANYRNHMGERLGRMIGSQGW